MDFNFVTKGVTEDVYCFAFYATPTRAMEETAEGNRSLLLPTLPSPTVHS